MSARSDAAGARTAGGGAGDDRADDRLKRGVGRDHLREVHQGGVPVEPRRRDRVDGPDARLRERGELRELAEAVGRGLLLGDLRLEARQLGRARGDRVVRQHVHGHERDRGREEPEQHVHRHLHPGRGTAAAAAPRESAGIRFTALMRGSPRRSVRRPPRGGRRRRRRTRRAGPPGPRRPRAGARPPRRAARGSRGSPPRGR